MTYESPEAHCDASIARFAAWKKAKYDVGQTEHGGRFWRKPVLRYMRDEIVDLCFYYDVLAEQHETAMDILVTGLRMAEGGSHSLSATPTQLVPSVYVEMALNVLRFGNPEGTLEEEHNGPKD
jgi:hypothetical protein